MKLYLHRYFFLFIVFFLITFWYPYTPAHAATYIQNGYITEEPLLDGSADVKVLEPENTWWNRYVDHAYGYSFRYPAQMNVDVSLSPVRTLFADANTSIEVYHDNFANSESSPGEYVEYGNRFTGNTQDHWVEKDSTTYINVYKTHLLKWTRRNLSRIPNDKNHYFSAEMIKNSNEVYTLFIKSSQPIENEMEILRSFTFFEKKGTPQFSKHYYPSKTPLSKEAVQFLNRYFSPSAPFTWGVFEPSAPEVLTQLTAMEEAVQHPFTFLIRYQTLEENAPIYGLKKAYGQGKYVELTLQTVEAGPASARPDERIHPNARILYSILDGKYDDYFAEYAERLKSFGHPVLFRLNNEMNGDWCWYSAFYTSKDAELYKASWRYIHQIFDEHGVDNVIWVWNPHDLSRPEFKWNHFMAYYPGDEYVDVIGLTGYNTGTYFPGERWRSFSEIYAPMYDQYSALFDKPFMITEFASNSVGGSKTAWMKDMFEQLPHYPNIKAAIWWSGVDYDRKGNPGRIYLLNEDEDTLKTFREHVNKKQ